MKITESIEGYLATLAGKSPNTVNAYRRGLDLLERSLGDDGRDQVDQLTDDVAEVFYLELLEQVAPQTANLYASAVRGWLGFLVRRKLLPVGFDAMAALEALKAVVVTPGYRAPRTDVDCEAVVQAAYEVRLPRRRRTQNAVRLQVLRDRALIRVLYATGLRRDEVRRLNTTDIDDDAIILTGKGGRERVAFLTAEAIEAVRVYLDERPPIRPRRGSQPLFTSDRGRGKGRISLRQISRVVAQLASLAYARRLIRNGVDLAEVQDLLGHASPVTTKTIYARFDRAHLERAHQRSTRKED